MRKALVGLLLVVLAIGACGGDDPAPTADDPAPTPIASPPIASPPDQVTGVLIDIVSSEIDDIQSFTLKDGDMQYDIFIAEDVEYGFPLGHLQEHLQMADPVTVDLEQRDGKLYALTIEDA